MKVLFLQMERVSSFASKQSANTESYSTSYCWNYWSRKNMWRNHDFGQSGS